MGGIVKLEATRGPLQGQVFSYTENIPRLYIGRHSQCAIVVSDRRVSRFHCVLEIQPPVVRLQDFGSLNGTYLDGRLIGQRKAGTSAEDGREEVYGTYELHDGSRLGLGADAEFLVHIERKEYCSLCGTLIPEETEKEFSDAEGRPLCENCCREQNEKKRANTRLCSKCHKPFVPLSEDAQQCPDCLSERGRIIEDALAALRLELPKKPTARPEPPGVPAILEGYEQLDSLGKGGQGEVFRVRRCRDGREFALKVMNSKAVRSERGEKLFLREANICKYIHHKNVVESEDVGFVDGIPYILMELCDGGNAYERMQSAGGKLPMELASYIILQTLAGLDYVHNMELDVHIPGVSGGYDMKCKGIVHRDFKPENIFLCGKGEHPLAKIADFGTSKAMDAAGLTDISRPGTDLAGTYGFMSKTLAMDSIYASPPVDVWAAAASYYNMLTGFLTRDFSARKHSLNVIVSEKVKPIRERDECLPSALAEVIDYALIEEPQIGFGTASAFRKALLDVLPASVLDYCEDIL